MRCLFILLVFCFCQPVSAQNKTVKAASDIKNVTVFSSGARIERTAATIDNNTGIVNWNISLQPGEERKLLMSFVVKYPRDKRVVLE